MAETFDGPGPLHGKKAEIVYPCRWTIKVIGRDEALLRAAIAGVVGDDEHDLELSNRSSKGRYLSLHLEVLMRDEAHRMSIWEGLVRHADVKYLI